MREGSLLVVVTGIEQVREPLELVEHHQVGRQQRDAGAGEGLAQVHDQPTRPMP